MKTRSSAVIFHVYSEKISKNVEIWVRLWRSADEILIFRGLMLHRCIKANTSKHRTHSLFSQGRIILKLIPTLRTKWYDLLMQSVSTLFENINGIKDAQYLV